MSKAVTKFYKESKIVLWYIERADYYLSQHIGQEVTIKEVRDFAYTSKAGGGLACHIVRRALERYETKMSFTFHNVRLYDIIKRKESEIPVDVDFALGDKPTRRDEEKEEEEQGGKKKVSPYTKLWRALMSNYAPYRGCITKTREEAIRWNEANIGKNKSVVRLFED